MPIGVVILVNPIDKVDLMPNCILTMPYIIVLSYMPVSSLQNAKNQLYPAIKRLDAPVSIIILTKLSIVQWDIDMVTLQVKGSYSVIRGTILSIVITKQLKALLAKVVAIEIALCYSTQLKEVQK